MELRQPVTFWPKEEWRYITRKSVPNIIDEESYIISSYGRVFSFIRNNIMNQQITANGYYRTCLKLLHGGSRYILTHRIEMIEFIPIEGYEKYHVNHIDGVRTNNMIWNLEWVTPSENIKKAYENGTKIVTANNRQNRITEEQAEYIAQLICTQKYTNKQIAAIVGVKYNIVAAIALGNTWPDIFEKYGLYKYTRKYKTNYSPEQVELMCQYYINNKDRFYTIPELYASMVWDLFEIVYDGSVGTVLFNIFEYKTLYRDITLKYNI